MEHLDGPGMGEFMAPRTGHVDWISIMFKLQDMRNTKKIKWLMYIGFGVIIISFVFFYGWQNDPRGSNEPIPLAKLGNRTIYQTDLARPRESLINQKISRLDANTGRFLGRNRNQLNQLYDFEEVVEEAANLILLDSHSKSVGLDLSREKLAEDFRNIPGLAGANITWKQLDQQLQGRITSLSRNLKASLAHASLFEVWQEYLLANEELTLDIAAYPSANYEAQVVTNNDQLEDYLNKNPGEFHVSDQRRYQFVKLTRDDMLDALKISNEQLQAFYEQNQSDYVLEAAIKTEDIVMPASDDRSSTQAASILSDARNDGRLTSGTWYDLAAELNTENPGLRFFPGSTGWMEEDSQSRPPTYIQTVHSLSDDEISSPIITNQGVYIARITERRPGGTQLMEDVRFEVERDYKNSKIDELFDDHYQSWKDELENIRGSKGSLRDFSNAVMVDDQLTTLVDRTQYFLREIGSDFSDDSEYFEMLELEEISDVIRKGNLLVVLQIIQEVDEHDPPLEQIRPEVETAVKRERAHDLAQAAAEQAHNLVSEGADFMNSLADAPREPFTTDSFKRTQAVPRLNYPLIGFNEATLNLGAETTGILPYGYDKDKPIGYAVWKVVTLKEPDKDNFRAERTSFVASYLALQQNAIIGEWLKDMREKDKYSLVDRTD